MSFFDQINNRYKELLKEKNILKQQLDKSPAGTLTVSRQNNRYSFRYRLGQETPIYIKSGNRKFAQRLAAKAVRSRRLDDIEREISAIESYLKKYDGKSSVDEFLKNHPGHRMLAEECGASYGHFGTDLLKNLDWINKVRQDQAAYELLLKHVYRDKDQMLRWRYEPEEPTATNQNERTVNTLCGVLVRSKAEAIFADEFYRAGVLFIYEPPHQVNGKTYYPDFIIFHPVSGKLIIFEYLGLMPDNMELKSDSGFNPQIEKKIRYRNNNAEKIRNYILAGYLPGKTLVCVSESINNPFDTAFCRSIVKCFFTE